MKPANDPAIDYQKVVQEGYDQCAAAYEQARRNKAHPELTLLIDRLPTSATVLDLGCGAGVPIARTLAQHFAITGVDSSGEQIRRAHINVPSGTFLCDDISEIDFPSASFDAVVAFYSIFHLPREKHLALFQRIHTWLKSDGYLLATVTKTREDAYTKDDFFGVTMYWSNYSLTEYQKMLQQVGFQLIDMTTIGHGYIDTRPDGEVHPLVFAQKTMF
ncbi:MAG: class I SAM-dependent methyltransferase [Chloroflexota bacterium]